ncbi:MAG TPA: ATP-binding protein [Bacteroidales bacterium]|nr:ATP-binding protein [Bacteroidales bacterium]HPS61647.1 ATP-binding protein [Bacteroidales bacterium]
MYTRDVEKELMSWMDSREILIIYGARQVGKTTLMEMLASRFNRVLYLNCENSLVFDLLASRDLARIRSYFGDNRIVLLDEAQVISQIGSVLKLIYDSFPEIKLIVSGSSSFDLMSRVSEPLTGRNLRFRLFPLSVRELIAKHQPHKVRERINELLVFGSYPGIVDLSREKKIRKLDELISDYLFKDLLSVENLKDSVILRNLIRLLAFQAGDLVSAHELSLKLGLTIPMVEKYLDLLEKTFVIFSLGAYSTNLRNEIRKSRKYYFFDNGIRNAVIHNFNPVENRDDTGRLWENFCLSERFKLNCLNPQPVNLYFWRTYDGAEIDLIEESGGVLRAFECKWNPSKKARMPFSFRDRYHTEQLTLINPDTMIQFLS